MTPDVPTPMSSPRLEADRSATGFMGRHFVALTCEYESLNPNGSVFHHGTAVFSGFIIEFLGKWFWLTAGHIFTKYLDHPINRNELRVIGGSFVDYLGFEAKHFVGYPYIYSAGDAAFVYNRDLGLDYALIALDGLKQVAFQKNNVVPLERSSWEHQHRLTFEFYRMLGVPKTEVVPSSHQEDGVAFRLAMLAIDRLTPDEISILGDVPDGMFVGRIPEDATIKTVEGMSGGPIYGFRRVGKDLIYHPVAVQSFWRPDSRLVFACPLPAFAEAVYQK